MKEVITPAIFSACPGCTTSFAAHQTSNPIDNAITNSTTGKKTEYAKIALQNADLYNTIIAHRKHYAPLAGVDFEKYKP